MESWGLGYGDRGATTAANYRKFARFVGCRRNILWPHYANANGCRGTEDGRRIGDLYGRDKAQVRWAEWWIGGSGL